LQNFAAVHFSEQVPPQSVSASFASQTPFMQLKSSGGSACTVKVQEKVVEPILIQ
jgi:hypothetical protein